MGFQEILRALPMTDTVRDLELDACKEYEQSPEYAELFKREFRAGTGGGGVLGNSVATVVQTARPGKAHRSLSHFLMARADPLTATYANERRDDLAEYLRHKMLAFLNDPLHVAVMGRRKCYEAGWFFERPRPYLERATPQQWASLTDILTHILGTSATALPEEAMRSTTKEATVMLYGGRHKWLEASRT
jgi:hypothetical protein